MDLKREYGDIAAAAAGHLELLSLSGVSMLPAHRRPEECKRCALHRGRRHAVRGEGSAKAGLMFIGGAPGGADDSSGRPFSGPVGELLTRIISAMGFNRQDVFITRVLKCAAPESASSLDREVSSCRPFLEKEITGAAPRVIVALGGLATSAFLGNTPFNDARGKFYAYGEALLMPAYDPAALLKRPDLKKDAWKDMLKVVEELKKPH